MHNNNVQLFTFVIFYHSETSHRSHLHSKGYHIKEWTPGGGDYRDTLWSITTINKTQTKSLNKNREYYITNISKEKRDITKCYLYTKQIIREYYEWYHVNIFTISSGLDTFTEDINQQNWHKKKQKLRRNLIAVKGYLNEVTKISSQ